MFTVNDQEVPNLSHGCVWLMMSTDGGRGKNEVARTLQHHLVTVEPLVHHYVHGWIAAQVQNME